MTPDLLGGDITNPQSLNRYAYALNNPTTLTDPLGLDPCTIDGQPAICTTSTATAPDQPPFYIGPCSYEAIEEAACYGGSSPAPPGWYEGSTSGGTSAPQPVVSPPSGTVTFRNQFVLTAGEVMSLVAANNESNQCAELVDCIVFRESHLGASGVPSGLGAGFDTMAGVSVHPAEGLMQLEPCKFEGPCIGQYDPTNPVQNIQVGSKFLQQKISHLGSVKSGVNSYGPGGDYASRVLDCVKKLQAGDLGGAYAAATAH